MTLSLVHYMPVCEDSFRYAALLIKVTLSESDTLEICSVLIEIKKKKREEKTPPQQKVI